MLSIQSKLNPEINPTCRLCLQANETLHHLMSDCEATTSLQMDIMKNEIPLPHMTWSGFLFNLEFTSFIVLHLAILADGQTTECIHAGRHAGRQAHSYNRNTSSVCLTLIPISSSCSCLLGNHPILTYRLSTISRLVVAAKLASESNIRKYVTAVCQSVSLSPAGLTCLAVVEDRAILS